MQASAENTLEEMSKKFRQVKPMNDGAVQLQDNFIEAYDVELNSSKDLKDTVLFSCRIRINGEKYGLRIHRNTSIIVQLKDGAVNEYVLSAQNGLFSEKMLARFSPGWYSTETELPEIQIFTESADDVEYIKLTNAAVFDQQNTQQNILPGAEFELYSSR